MNRRTNSFPTLRQPPLRLARQPLITPGQSDRVHQLARRILAELGMEVNHPEHLAALKKSGLRTAGNRVLFEPARVDAFVSEISRRYAARAGETGEEKDDGQLGLSVSSYSLFMHDLETDRAVEYNTARLIEMTKLIDSLADQRVFGAPPGIPLDVPPDLQPLAQYRIAALYARQGATPVDPTSAKTAGYLFDMAEVMGNPIRELPVYIPTPLRLGGEPLEVVLACLDRLEHIAVSSMPAAGTSAPIHPFGGLALAAAEVIGGAMAVQILTGKPVSFHIGLFPSDLREGAMVFGSPENMLYYMLAADFSRVYGRPANVPPDNIHVMAKLPDAQAAAEKAAIMALGGFLGNRHFSCAGTLSLDEIFSPEQLLVDCEIRDWVERAIQGAWLGEEAVDDWLGSIREGIQHGFMGQDTTLDHYREHAWYPRWFNRGAIGPWLNRGQPRLASALHAEVRRRIASHDFELDPARRAEIERIYAAARTAVEK